MLLQTPPAVSPAPRAPPRPARRSRGRYFQKRLVRVRTRHTVLPKRHSLRGPVRNEVGGRLCSPTMFIGGFLLSTPVLDTGRWPRTSQTRHSCVHLG